MFILGGAGRDGIGYQTGEASGNDILEGGEGADILYGGDGNDFIAGGGDFDGTIFSPSVTNLTYYNPGADDTSGDVVYAGAGNRTDISAYADNYLLLEERLVSAWR